MTTYLTKIEDGKTHHFRVAVKGNGVEIIHGVFYNWLNKYFEGCGSSVKAEARKNQLIDEKLKDEYQIAAFNE